MTDVLIRFPSVPIVRQARTEALPEPIDIEEVPASVHRIAGDDLGLAELGWSMRYLSERRQADSYRWGGSSRRGPPPTSTRRWGRWA